MSVSAEKTKARQGASHQLQIKQLNRIEGQVRGVTRMIEEKRYCIDILTQIKAIKSSLGSIESKIINEHINHCVHEAVNSKNARQTSIVLDEIRQLIKSAKLS